MSRLGLRKRNLTFRAVGFVWVTNNASDLVHDPGRISNALGRRILLLEGFLHSKQN